MYRNSSPTLQISGWKFDNLHIKIRQRLCEAFYKAGRMMDAGESLLKMVNTLDEQGYMNGSLTEWISGELLFNQFCCRVFEICPQISPTDASPLLKLTATRPRTQLSTMKRQHLSSTHGPPPRY